MIIHLVSRQIKGEKPPVPSGLLQGYCHTRFRTMNVQGAPGKLILRLAGRFLLLYKVAGRILSCRRSCFSRKNVIYTIYKGRGEVISLSRCQIYAMYIEGDRLIENQTKLEDLIIVVCNRYI